MPLQRLDRFISNQLNLSRKEVKEGIKRGFADVNGKTVTRPEYTVDTLGDRVCFNGQAISFKEHIYIVMNKPAGVLSASEDKSRKTVVDIIPDNIRRKGLFPVGRLDYDTSGLLLLTNDGDFSYRVTHPKFHIDKTYVASVKGGLTVSALKRLRSGVKIEDYTTSPAEVELLDSKDGFSRIKITIHEGKNRQVRKMFEAVGCKVVTLQRISIGTVSLGNLPLGRWRYLTSHEVSYLMGV